MKYRVQNIVNNEYLDDDVIFLLPNGEVGWFIRDGSYPHYRKFGHQEDFKVINTDYERLQKQLDLACNTLCLYAESPYPNPARTVLDRIAELGGDYSHYWEQQLKDLELNK